MEWGIRDRLDGLEGETFGGKEHPEFSFGVELEACG